MNDRALFIATMRRPEMRILLTALQHLHIDKAIDWRAIQSMEMYRYSIDSWMLITDIGVTVTHWLNKPVLSIYDFNTYRYDEADEPQPTNA